MKPIYQQIADELKERLTDTNVFTINVYDDGLKITSPIYTKVDIDVIALLTRYHRVSYYLTNQTLHIY